MKYLTKSYYVDQETGELLSKKQIDKKEYTIIKTKKKINNYDTYTVIERTNECRRNQRTIW